MNGRKAWNEWDGVEPVGMGNASKWKVSLDLSTYISRQASKQAHVHAHIHIIHAYIHIRTLFFSSPPPFVFRRFPHPSNSAPVFRLEVYHTYVVIHHLFTLGFPVVVR